MKINVCVLGGGSWATTVASLASKKNDTLLWARNENTVAEINQHNKNSRYLPGATLHKNLRATGSISEAVANADVVVVGIPSQSFREVLTLAKPYIRPWVPIVSISKGFELNTNLRMSEIIAQVLPSHPVGVLTGPNLAKEIHAGFAAAAVLAMVDKTIAKRLQQVFSSGLFRVYTNNDLIGCELGGALKNIIAIATGMSDGANAGDNTRAALITRGLSELTRLGRAMGGRKSTFFGLAGLGDLVVTCSSSKSRNYHVGFSLGQGKKLQQIIEEMNEVAEGVKATKVAMELAKSCHLDVPITREVYRVLYEGISVQECFKALLKIESGSEKEPG